MNEQKPHTSRLSNDLRKFSPSSNAETPAKTGAVDIDLSSPQAIALGQLLSHGWHPDGSLAVSDGKYDAKQIAGIRDTLADAGVDLKFIPGPADMKGLKPLTISLEKLKKACKEHEVYPKLAAQLYSAQPLSV